MTKRLKSDEEKKFIETYAVPLASVVPTIAEREVEPVKERLKVVKLAPIYNRTGIFAEGFGSEDRISWADVVQPPKLETKRKLFWQHYV